MPEPFGANLRDPVGRQPPLPQVQRTRIAPMPSGLQQLPPVPGHLAATLRPQGESVFATRPLESTPYDLGHFLAELEADPGLPAYAAVGFDGHGINSWAAHGYVVDDAIALFIQLPWGGAYDDADEARAEIADVFAWAAQLQSKVQAAAKQQKIPVGWRLQVAATRFGRAGWRWLVAGQDNAAIEWQAAGGMKATLLAMLDDVIGGKLVPQD